MRDIEELFAALAKSPFRRRFRLGEKDRVYGIGRSRGVILDHGRDFIRRRLAPAVPENDGRQTPMRGHPIFVAQHATATCCRVCLRKWHDIDECEPLNDAQVEYVIDVLARWLDRQIPWTLPANLDGNYHDHQT